MYLLVLSRCISSCHFFSTSGATDGFLNSDECLKLPSGITRNEAPFTCVFFLRFLCFASTLTTPLSPVPNSKYTTGGRQTEGPEVLAEERRHEEHCLLRRGQPQPRHLHLGGQLLAELGLA